MKSGGRKVHLDDAHKLHEFHADSRELVSNYNYANDTFKLLWRKDRIGYVCTGSLTYTTVPPIDYLTISLRSYL